MAKKNVGEKTAGEKRAPIKDAAEGRSPEKRRRRRTRPRSKVASSRTAADAVSTPRETSEANLNALLGEVRTMKEMVRKLVTRPNIAGATPGREAVADGSDIGASDTDAVLEGAVDSLRRLLSELLERRMESVLSDLVDIRREALAAANGQSRRVVERLDQILETLGAVRFDAEPLDVVDPLIHSVVDERWQKTEPDGVILETMRPGYRTARGLVLCRAAVAVNRRS